MAHLGGDFGQCPTAGQIARHDHLGSIDQSLAASTRGRCVRGARPERTFRQRQREALRLERFGDVRAETVPKQRRERLRSRIDAQTLRSKNEASDFAQQASWRQFIEYRFADDEIHAGIAARYGMADPVAFVRVEEEYLVRFGDRIVSTEVPHVEAAIREHHVSGVRGFLFAAMPAAALALDISDGDELRFQERSRNHLGHGW